MMTERIRKAERQLLWTMSGLVLLIAASLLWYLVLEPSWLSYRNVPFPVQTPSVMQGEAVLLTVERCNSDASSNSYQTTRTLVNVRTGARIMIESAKADIMPGCTSETSGISSVPLRTPPDPYYLEGVADVRGTVRTKRIPWYSQEFTVVARPLPQ